MRGPAREPMVVNREVRAGIVPAGVEVKLRPGTLGHITQALGLLALIIPLYLAGRMIHQKIYVIGYLLTKDKQAATVFYYLVFFPGVFLHEFLQYLLAGVLNVKIKKIITHPQKQEDGTLRYDFVVIEKDKLDTLRASILGCGSFFHGMCSCLVDKQLSARLAPSDRCHCLVRVGGYFGD